MITSLFRLIRQTGLSPGQKLDELVRRIKLRRWRRSSKIRVRSGGNFLDLNVRKGTTDYEVVWQCFVEQQYCVPVIAKVPSFHRTGVTGAYRSILARGKTPLILDCGANIGASAAWFHMNYPGSTIIAVEPAPQNCRMLHGNIGCLSNVDIIEAGIGSSDSTSYLVDDGNGDWGYRTSTIRSDTEVRIVSIDSILASYPETLFEPLILKVDIEGAEAELFSRSWNVLNAFPLIIVEPHDFCMPRQGTSINLFKFHAAMGREFLFGFENVFSIRTDLLAIS